MRIADDARCRSRRLLVPALAAIGVLAGGCGEDARLDALRADPLAAHAPAGGRLVREVNANQSDGGLLGKPSEAELVRLYALGAGAEARFAAALEAASRAGWQQETESADGVALFTKRLRNGRATATVSLLREDAGLPDATAPPALHIRLLHHGP